MVGNLLQLKLLVDVWQHQQVIKKNKLSIEPHVCHVDFDRFQIKNQHNQSSPINSSRLPSSAVEEILPGV